MSAENLKFSKEHEWIMVSGDEATVGVTDYAQHELGDIVYVELPATGKTVKKGDPCANIESVKAVSDVYSPVAGTVSAVNGGLADHPELVNQAPQGDGWLFRIKMSHPADLDELMDKAKYDEYLKGIAGE